MRFAILCTLALAALAGANAQAADWGSSRANNTTQSLSNAIARATETVGLKIVGTEAAITNLEKGVNTTALAAAGVNPVIAAATNEVTGKVASLGKGFAFLTTSANSGSVVSCQTDSLNGTVSANCTTAVSNLNAFAPGGASAAVLGISVQGLLAYVVVSNTAANNQTVVACDVSYLTGALSGCAATNAFFRGVVAVTPGLKGARLYAATRGSGVAAAGVGGAYECALSGKAISGCSLTGTPKTSFNGAQQLALATRGFAYLSNFGSNTISTCNITPETGLLANCSTALSSGNANTPKQLVERDGFLWWAQQTPNTIAYASIAAASGDLSGTTVIVKNLPTTSAYLAFGQGNRLYSASISGKVTRCAYVFQALSKALGSTPYPPVVNQCVTAQASVEGTPVQAVAGFAFGPSNY